MVPTQTDTVPLPSKVLLRSSILPGWGQSVNRQFWKIPVIYGVLGGVAWFAREQHRSYTDFRAAYYNSIPGRVDTRYGPTPPALEGLPQDLLRYNRNSYRNRRDLSIIVFVAAWGLNAVDAYVFAHLRDFDTGPDLSVVPGFHIHPETNSAVPKADIKVTIPINKGR